MPTLSRGYWGEAILTKGLQKVASPLPRKYLSVASTSPLRQALIWVKESHLCFVFPKQRHKVGQEA